MTRRGEEIKLKAGLSGELKSLLQKLLEMNPKDRPSIKAIFQSPWMKKYSLENAIDLNNFLEANRTNASYEMGLNSSRSRKRLGSCFQEHQKPSGGSVKRYTDGPSKNNIQNRETQATQDPLASKAIPSLNQMNSRRIEFGNDLAPQTGNLDRPDVNQKLSAFSTASRPVPAEESKGWFSGLSKIFEGFGCF